MQTRSLPTELRKVRLSGSKLAVQGGNAAGSWHKVIEEVIQKSILLLTDNRDSGITMLESTVFARCLSETAAARNKNNEYAFPELRLFSKPVALYSFELRCGVYEAHEHVFSSAEAENLDQPFHAKRQDIILNKLKMLSALKVDLEDVPTIEELLTILLDQIQEAFRNAPETGGKEEGPEAAWSRRFLTRVHSARRASLRNWEQRLVALVRGQHDHRDDERSFFSHPYVQAYMPDGVHLLLVFVSPLDENFVDMTISTSQRSPEITLALFDVGDLMYPDAIDEVTPVLKNAFGRLMFTNMLNETDSALRESFQERAAIVRHWSRIGGDGLAGVFSQEQCRLPFDGFQFCEAIAKKVLCAQVPGVEKTETYPFERIFVLKESGTSSNTSDKPMELLVMEAAMISNKPSDRNRCLTSRERKIRDTEIFECNPSHKVIESYNIRRFYIHPGDENSLILSRRKKLPSEVKLRTLSRTLQSYNEGEADTTGYRIDLPAMDDVEHDDLKRTLYNLLGRLISVCKRKEPVKSPDGTREYQVVTFSDDFDRLRLKVLEKFDEEGLFFSHHHGVDIQEDFPLLFQLQRAYFSYLDDKFQNVDLNFLQDQYRQKNMRREEIQEILEAHTQAQKDKRRVQRKAADDSKKSKNGQTRQRSKVIYISFSWDMHDENMQIVLNTEHTDAAGEKGKLADEEALLGKEYSYTMILVADQDQEKSVARLKSEREDLKLFFQLIMRQIWMDKRREFEELDQRRQSIAACLSQFAHRTKGLLEDDLDKAEIDEFLRNIKGLMSSKRPRPDLVEVSGLKKMHGMLAEGLGSEGVSMAAFEKFLAAQMQKLNRSSKGDGSAPCSIRVIENQTPALNLLWSDAVIRDAFIVAFRNAVEATLGLPREQRKVTVEHHAYPSWSEDNPDKWFVDIVITNTGGPINAALLKKLNAAVPQTVDRNTEKANSTGIGVYLSRYQLQEVLRMGADMVISNTAEDTVQTRIRLPAFSINEEAAVEAPDGSITSPKQDYLLYVEDDPHFFHPTIEAIKPLLEDRGLTLRHTRGALEAQQMIKSRMPAAVFSDYCILKDDADTASKGGQKQFFELFFSSFLEKAESLGKKPPIWIFSGDPGSTLEQDLRKLDAKSQYRCLQSESADPHMMIKQGCLSIISGTKWPHKVDKSLLNLLWEALETDHRKANSTKLVTVEDEGTQDHIRVCTVDKAGGIPDSLAETWKKTNADSVLMLRAACATGTDAASALNAWFSHEGLPNIDPDMRRLAPAHKLCSRVYHKNLLLCVQAKNDIPWITPKMKYFGITQNIWFAPPQTPLGSLGRTWLSMISEDRGPLSVIRHQISNEWRIDSLNRLKEELVQLINQVEKALEWPDPKNWPGQRLQQLNKLLADSKNPKSKNAALKAYVDKSDNTPKKQDKVLSFLDNAIALLNKGGETEVSIRNNAIIYAGVAETLRSYIGGSYGC